MTHAGHAKFDRPETDVGGDTTSNVYDQYILEQL
jgi:hypothetical protein